MVITCHEQYWRVATASLRGEVYTLNNEPETLNVARQFIIIYYSRALAGKLRNIINAVLVINYVELNFFNIFHCKILISFDNGL